MLINEVIPTSDGHGVNFSLHHNLEYIEFSPRTKVGHFNFSHPYHNWTRCFFILEISNGKA